VICDSVPQTSPTLIIHPLSYLVALEWLDVAIPMRILVVGIHYFEILVLAQARRLKFLLI
jgi:hypothetical protein